ncbi:MAG: YdcF family protein [Thermosynechococcaceae cyanobacterium]
MIALFLTLISVFILRDMIKNYADHETSANFIVVLGRGPSLNDERALVAAQLYEKNRASRIFVSGMMDAPKVITLLEQMGIPENRIGGEGCSVTTWENGLFTKILLSPLKPQRILLVTDKAHMRRAASVFRGFGFNVIPYPVKSEISLEQGLQQLRELVALIVYKYTGKLTQARPEKVQQDEAEAKYKIQAWNCRLGIIHSMPLK